MKITVWIVFSGLILLSGFTASVDALPWPPTISVYSISFNYESGNSNDALAIKKNNSTSIPVPEWLTGSRNERFAYLKGQPNRKVRAQFYIEPSGYYNSNIDVYASVSGDGIGYINLNTVYFQGSQYSTPKVMTCQSSISGSVNKKSFSWNWYVDLINGNELEEPIYIGMTGSHTYYILLDTPQQPMSIPWTDVLDYACVWAAWKTTSSSALEALTTKLYNNSELYYDGGQSHYEYDRWPNPTKFEFNLTRFLDEWDKADCQDCGMFLSILSGSIGASLTQSRRIQGYFSTKNICAIGWSSTRWESTGWNFHHIGWLNNVYDSSVKLKQSSPYLPINKDINNPYKTDLYDSGSWSPKNAFRLGQTDPYWNVPTYIK